MGLKHTVMLGCGQVLSLSFLWPSKVQSKRVLVYEWERDRKEGSWEVGWVRLDETVAGFRLASCCP